MFLSARLKIDRANKLRQDIKKRICDLPKQNIASVEPDPQGMGNTITHDIPEFDDIKNDIAIIAGDCIHNFRTALDYAWVQSIKNIGLPINRHTKFPIRSDSNALEAALKGIKIDTFSPQLFAVMVRDIKAYGAANPELWALHNMDITDKHELLLTVLSYESINNIRTEDETGDIEIGGTWGGQHSNPIRIDVPHPVKIHHAGDRSMTISIDNGDVFKDLPIVELLQIFSRLTMDIVQKLETVTER